jgi:hypothetical protein
MELATSRKIKSYFIKHNGEYKVLLYTSPDELENLLQEFSPEEPDKGYEEDETKDLNDFLSQVGTAKRVSEQLYLIKMFFTELKRLTERKRIVSVHTPNGKRNIRKIGRIEGNLPEDIVIEVSGDHRGMITWDRMDFQNFQKIISLGEVRESS